jgi:hypothetical protein
VEATTTLVVEVTTTAVEVEVEVEVGMTPHKTTAVVMTHKMTAVTMSHKTTAVMMTHKTTAVMMMQEVIIPHKMEVTTTTTNSMTSISKIVHRTPSSGYGILLSLVTKTLRTLPIVNVHLRRSSYRTDFLTVRMQQIVLLTALKAATFATLV